MSANEYRPVHISSLSFSAYESNNGRSLKRRSQHPRSKLFVADAGQFALGLFTAGHREDLLKDPHADLLDSFGAVQDGAGVDVHVFVHPVVERRIGGDLDAGRRFTTVNTAASGREDADSGTA